MTRFAIFAAFIAALGCGTRDPAGKPHAAETTAAPLQPVPPPPPTPFAGTPTQAEMHNVRLHLDDHLTLNIRSLRGKLVPTSKSIPPSLDDKRSFTLAIDAGQVATSAAGLSYVLNRYVFAYPGAPVGDLEISMQGKRMKIKGKLRKKLGISFEMLGDIEATSNGKLRVHPVSFKAAHLPVKGLMHFFGKGMDDLIDTSGAPGVEIDQDDLILDPEKILPPPHMKGVVTRAWIEGGQLIENFGTGGYRPGRKTNFLYLRGGNVGFGRLVMHDTDLLMEDAHPEAPLGFYLDHYMEQLAAGYCKISRASGLHVFVEDYEKVKAK